MLVERAGVEPAPNLSFKLLLAIYTVTPPKRENSLPSCEFGGATRSLDCDMVTAAALEPVALLAVPYRFDIPVETRSFGGATGSRTQWTPKSPTD